MDLHGKQWRNQHESEQQPSANIPKRLLLIDPQHQQQHASSLPNRKISGNLSAPLPDSNARMGSYFNLAQWQELELQALIYRYILAGAAVPAQLLQPIKKSLLYSSTYFLHHPYSHYQPACYWGRAAIDPEPGRCRRTDGKKWRCSRDVVTGQKYCERHVHRGRNRSRKPVEMPTSSNFGFSRPSPPVDIRLRHSIPASSSESKDEHKGLFEAQSEVHNRSDGHILRHFFDDWPRTLEEPGKSGTNLSISMPGNSSSDVSLKLSTGNGDQLGPSAGGREHQNWAMDVWAASNGGPLAEALHSSSTSNTSPTSVLHQLPKGSTSEFSYIST